MAEIREFQESQRDEVLALYRTVFGAWSAERFAARWDWQFASNPFVSERRPLIQVAVDNGRVIGHLASFPVPVRLNGQRKIALCASDFLVDKGHPTASAVMFRALMRRPPVLGTGFATPAESMLRLSGATLLPASAARCSFQIRSTGAVRRAMKRRLPSSLGFLAAPIVARPLAQIMGRPDRPLKKGTRRLAGGGTLREFSRFTAEHEALWLELSKDLKGAIDKDARYMNWRYADGPARSLVLLELRDAKALLRGIIVGGIRADLHEHQPCGTTGVVCELWARRGDPEAARELAFGVLERLDAAEVDAVNVHGLPTYLQEALADAGFVRGESKEYQVAIKAAPGELDPDTATQPDRYWVSAGDGDMLLATML